MPGKIAILAIIIAVLLGFVIGFVYWNKDSYKCFDGKHFYGEWITLYAVGKFELRVREYGCVKTERYDPREWKDHYIH